MYQYKSKEQPIELKTRDGVFYPTDTTELLIAGASRAIKKPGTLLDLGCGSGVIAIVLAKMGLAVPPLYASDLSQDAVALTQENAADHGVAVVAKQGSLFEPWEGQRFDIIVDDVSGVAEEIAVHSEWFPKGVPCAAGADGASLVSRVIEQAPEHLHPGGQFIFPVLSFSDTDKLLRIAREHFASVERMQRQMWPLPEGIKPHMAVLERLHGEKKIRLEKKFGMVLWYTEIYCASGAIKERT